MMRKVWWGAVVGLLAVLAGCSGGSPKVTPAELLDFKPTFAVKLAWTVNLAPTFSVGRVDNAVFSPVHVREHIFAAAANGSVSKISVADGSEEWRIHAGMGLTAGVGSDGNIVVVVGEKGTLLAFDADGKLRWKAQASSEILSVPVVAGGLVVVRSVDNRIAGYDAATGKRKWALDRPAPSLILRSSSGMVVAGPTVVVALPGGRLLSLNIANGGPRWEILVGESRGTTELERIADLVGSPALFDRDVCAAAYLGRIACMDIVTGATRWSKKLAASAGVSVDERYVYAVDERSSVYAFSRTGGESVWRTDKLAHRGLSAPVALGRHVAVADNRGYVHFLSREDGSFVNRFPTDGSPVIAQPTLAGSTLIVQTSSGKLFAFAAE